VRYLYVADLHVGFGVLTKISHIRTMVLSTRIAIQHVSKLYQGVYNCSSLALLPNNSLAVPVLGRCVWEPICGLDIAPSYHPRYGTYEPVSTTTETC
jgi:hypothetical protein